MKKDNDPVIKSVLTEQSQGHETRANIFNIIEKQLRRPIVSFFTSFRFPVMLAYLS